MLSKVEAQQIITEVTSAVRGWRKTTTRLSISKREIDDFAPVFDRFTR